MNPRIDSESVLDLDVREILARDLPWHRLNGKAVLVTGAGGMIPSCVVRALVALNDEFDAGIRVTGLVRSAQRARAALGAIVERADFHLLQQDVTEPLALSGQVDLVVHGASPARPALHASQPVQTIRANLEGTINLLEACVGSGAAFVLMSSAEVYGAVAGTGLISESDYGSVDILNPRSCYTEGKRAAEALAAAYHAQYGIEVTIARFGHIYGPGMALDDGRVQADFAADVVAGRDIVLRSDGSAQRAYTYVADAVAGLFHALLVGKELACNVADSGGVVSIRELAEAFARARPERGLSVVFGEGVDPSRYNPIRSQGLDDTRLRGLGWRPVVDLATGIDRTLSWHEGRAGA